MVVVMIVSNVVKEGSVVIMITHAVAMDVARPDPHAVTLDAANLDRYAVTVHVARLG
jgi:hypothetical protein